MCKRAREDTDKIFINFVLLFDFILFTLILTVSFRWRSSYA